MFITHPLSAQPAALSRRRRRSLSLVNSIVRTEFPTCWGGMKDQLDVTGEVVAGQQAWVEMEGGRSVAQPQTGLWPVWRAQLLQPGGTGNSVSRIKLFWRCRGRCWPAGAAWVRECRRGSSVLPLNLSDTAATSEDGSSLEFIAAITGRQCYSQDASGRGLWLGQTYFKCFIVYVCSVWPHMPQGKYVIR